MKKGAKKFSKRNFALTIILSIFISIMIITLCNLIVSYFYEPPEYDDFCGIDFGKSSMTYGVNNCASCNFSEGLQKESELCFRNRGIPVYDYDSRGCASSISECSFCGKDFDSAQQTYNRNTFFIFALIGFAIIVAGLFIHVLLIQIIALPAGAFLVIEAAVRNFDDKLSVIIVFALLISAAIYLALKKLGSK